MPASRSSYSAKFINYEFLESNFKYRRLNSKDVRNDNGEIIKDILCIDESEGLIIIGHMTYGDIVNFTCDDDFKDIKFGYPHGSLLT